MLLLDFLLLFSEKLKVTKNKIGSFYFVQYALDGFKRFHCFWSFYRRDYLKLVLITLVSYSVQTSAKK